MKVFLDTNIVIDFFAQREDFYRPAALIFDLANKKEIDIIVSATTFINAFYILRRKFDKNTLYNYMRGLSGLCHITPTDKSIIEEALSKEWDDFEDCAQALSAFTSEADVIVTRNAKDFENSTIKVQSPNEFLNEYFQ